MWNLDKIFISQMTPHILPSRASYGVSIAGILQNIGCVITWLYSSTIYVFMYVARISDT